MTPLTLDELEIQMALGIEISPPDIMNLSHYVLKIRSAEALTAFHKKILKVFSTNGYLMEFHVRRLVRDYIICHEYCDTKLCSKLIERYFTGNCSSLSINYILLRRHGLQKSVRSGD